MRSLLTIGLLVVLLTGLMAGCTAVQEKGSSAMAGGPGDIPTDLYRVPAVPLQTRWYTFENRQGLKGAGGQAKFGRKGSPATWIKPGESFEMLNIDGPGTIRRIWITVDPRTPLMQRAVKIEMYWDGATTPAVQGPIGDFFCHSLGLMVPFENACFSSPEGRSFNCIVPMPFKKNARIVVTNEGDKLQTFFYDVAATLGDRHGDDMMYFHSYWRRENLTQVRRDFTILPRVEGRGRFLGCNLGNRLHPALREIWFGEGEIKVYFDGDQEYPTLCGTGTEDYIGSAWGQGHFVNLFQGCQLMDKDKGLWGYYRFHIPDPVYFYKDCRVDIQVMMGPAFPQLAKAMKEAPDLPYMKAGDGTQYYTLEEVEANPRRAEAAETVTDYSATAYWYLDKPENGLPPIAGVAERTADLP